MSLIIVKNNILAIRNAQQARSLFEPSNPFWKVFTELGLIILLARQTPEERQLGMSVELNGVGFSEHSARNGGTWYAGMVAEGQLAGKAWGETLHWDKTPKVGKSGKPRRPVREEATDICKEHAKQIVAVLQSAPIEDIFRVLRPLIAPMAAKSAAINAKYVTPKIVSK